MKNIRVRLFVSVAVLLILSLSVAGLLWGLENNSTVLLQIRLPRMITAVLAGASLALAGSQMQSILRNPLADPYIMGISAGACLGAALAVILPGTEGVTVVAAAFLGAAVCGAVVLGVARKYQDARTLLVFGVLLGFIVNALVIVLQSSADAESLKMFYGWLAGSFSTAGWGSIVVMAAALLVGFAIAYIGRKGLDIILFGDEYAQMCGYSPSRVRLIALLSCCILTSAVTAFCGPIGFVGIVAPHIVRASCASSAHRVVLPLSVIAGAVLGISADLISRISAFPIPVSATMAIVGIPVIIYILLRKS